MTKPLKKSMHSKATSRVITTDAEIDAAIARAKVREAHRPYLTRAQYRATDDVIVLSLSTGVQVAIPRPLIQGLQGATRKALEAIQIEGPGTGLHWPTLDVDHYVPALLAGIFGTRDWMAELGQKGGKAKSPAKTAAARANGQRGGRPRKDSSHRAA